MAAKPKLLIITYIYPPVGGIGVQRALSFSRYLPDCGFETHVLTASNPAAPVMDPKLLDLVPPTVSIHHAMTAEPPFHWRKKVWSLLAAVKPAPSPSSPSSNPNPPAPRLSPVARLTQRLLCPDPQVLWTPFAIRKARQIIRHHKIDIVLATAPPFSVFLISNAIKKEFPNIKVVSDFRDEWLRFYLTDFDFLRSDYTVQRATAIERQTIECSDSVVAVTAKSLAEIRSRYPHQPTRKFTVVPNGFDPAALQSAHPRPHQSPGTMVVTHTGTAYSTASPKYYLDALDSLPEHIRSRIETRFIGRISESESSTFANRLSPVKLLGFLPQQQALHLTAETDYLLLTMTNDFSLPGKMFEYLAMHKPILALSPHNGEVSQLLAETNAGWCVNHDDPQAIRQLLLNAWDRLQHPPVSFHPNQHAIDQYQRPRLAARMADVFHGLLGSPQKTEDNVR